MRASDKPITVVCKLDAAFHDAVTFKDATPALPATEDSSEGDLVDGAFWPVDKNASRKQLVAQIGQMNFRLTALRQENAGLIKRAKAQAEVQAEPVACVYLVNTGEVRNGIELYERHDNPVPLAEYETLYTASQATQAEPVAWLHTDRLGDVQAFTTEPPPSLKAKCQPLYTAPQAQPADADDPIDRVFAKLMALTPEQLAERLKQYKGDAFAETLRHLNQATDALDAARFRWLVDDHEKLMVRIARNALCERHAVMSYSAACTDIDAAMAAAQEGGDAATGKDGAA